MLSSMTGFSSVSGEVRGFKFRIEARSLNHRFLELKTRLPGMLLGMEYEIEMLLRKFFERGRIEIIVSVEGEPEDFSFSWSRPFAKAYLKAFKEMKKELGIKGQVNLELLISQKDVIILEPERWGKEFWSDLEPLFRECFSALKKAREEEGERLSQEIKKRLTRIVELVNKIQGQQESVISEAKARLERKVNQLLGEEMELDPGRLAQEVAAIALRSDISEELERILSHLKQFELDIDQGGAKGKKLEFLVQELNREFNTIGAKTQNAELSQLSVEARTELERIRQQVQNLE